MLAVFTFLRFVRASTTLYLQIRDLDCLGLPGAGCGEGQLVVVAITATAETGECTSQVMQTMLRLPCCSSCVPHD